MKKQTGSKHGNSRRFPHRTNQATVVNRRDVNRITNLKNRAYIILGSGQREIDTRTKQLFFILSYCTKP